MMNKETKRKRETYTGKGWGMRYRNVKDEERNRVGKKSEGKGDIKVQILDDEEGNREGQQEGGVKKIDDRIKGNEDEKKGKRKGQKRGNFC